MATATVIFDFVNKKVIQVEPPEEIRRIREALGLPIIRIRQA
jgi:hypothetical protein